MWKQIGSLAIQRAVQNGNFCQRYSSDREKFWPTTIDHFASRLYHQLKQYVVWKPGSNTIGINAMQYIRNLGLGCAFHPFCMIRQVLAKVIGGKLDHLIIVTPVWHTQPWYTQLLCMSTQSPTLLLQKENLLVNPLSQIYHLITKTLY